MGSPLPNHMGTLGNGYGASLHNHGYPPCHEKKSLCKEGFGGGVQKARGCYRDELAAAAP